MTFGTRLRKNRDKKRLSQKEVAEQIGVSQTTYHNWEADVSSFRVEFLLKLTQVLEVDITDLIPGWGTDKPVTNQHQENETHIIACPAINMTDSRALYTELLDSKDEVIRLLKAENTLLKDRNAQLEDRLNVFT